MKVSQRNTILLVVLWVSFFLQVFVHLFFVPVIEKAAREMAVALPFLVQLLIVTANTLRDSLLLLIPVFLLGFFGVSYFTWRYRDKSAIGWTYLGVAIVSLLFLAIQIWSASQTLNS